MNYKIVVYRKIWEMSSDLTKKKKPKRKNNNMTGQYHRGHTKNFS